MAGASQQHEKQQELARQQQARRDLAKTQSLLRKEAKHAHAQHSNAVAAATRQRLQEEKKQGWLASIARTAQQAIQNRVGGARKSLATPQQNLAQELEGQLNQSQLQKSGASAALQSRTDALSSVLKEEQTIEIKLTPEQKRQQRAAHNAALKQELKTTELQEHVPLHQFLNQYRVVHGSGRPSIRGLLDQGLSLEEIKRVFEAYVVSFFHEISLAAGYLVRAYNQWIKGGHREEGRAPIGLFGEIVRQMQFSRGPAGFDDSDDNNNKKKKKLSLVATATTAVPQSGVSGA